MYKHALNVAILSALMANRAGLGIMEKTEVVVAALLHDVGKLFLPPDLRGKTENLEAEEKKKIAKSVISGIDKISNAFRMPAGVKGTLMQLCQFLYLPDNAPAKMTNAVKILLVANAFDEYTSMQLGMAPHSEVEAVRMLMNTPKLYAPEVVQYLIDSILILYPGVCVELTNLEKGLVIRENEKDILRPVILGFNTNQIYNLDMDTVYRGIQIKDIMKTMDNRIKVDPERLKEYM